MATISLFHCYNNNKFTLLLWKGLCPYEYMDDWKKFIKTPLSEKEDFYSHLNMEDITYVDYVHAKRVCKNFENLGEYHDLHLSADADILLIIERGIRGGICHSIYGYSKSNIKYMKDYDNNKESSYLQYWDEDNLYCWAMSQKLKVNNWVDQRYFSI